MKKYSLWAMALLLCISVGGAACKPSENWKTTVEPTCTTEGERVLYDGDRVVKTETVAALGHSWGDWVTVTEPSYGVAGEKISECLREGCDGERRDTIDPLVAPYTVELYDGNELADVVYVGEDRQYTMAAPQKKGYEFIGFTDEDGNEFALSGTLPQSVQSGERVKVFRNWSVVETTTFAQFREFVQSGVEDVWLTESFDLTDMVFVPGQTTVLAKETVTLRKITDRPAFVIGENADGEAVLNARLSLSCDEGKTLTIDGNKESTVSKNSAFLIVNSGTLNMYDGVSIANHKLVANEYAATKDYGVSTPIAEVGGAAVANLGGTLNVYGGSFAANESVLDGTSAFSGGAVFNFSTVNVYGGTFVQNAASRGGAVFNTRILNVYGGSFAENTASYYGGAVYLSNSQYAQLTVARSPYAQQGEQAETVVFDSNVATRSGGAIFGQSLNAVSIGMTQDKTETAVAVTFSKNRSQSNGGAINSSGALLLQNVTFTENTAQSKGGAVYVYYADDDLTVRQVAFYGCSFSKNEAPKGGAIGVSSKDSALESGASLSVERCTFTQNNAFQTTTADEEEGDSASSEPQYGYGGCIYLSRKGTLTATDSVFTSNTAESKGGCIYSTAEKTESTLKNCTFTQNSSLQRGGVLEVCNQSVVSLQSCTFGAQEAGNTAETYGGAIFVTKATLNVDNQSEVGAHTTFAYNTASSGGAIFLTTGSTATLHNTCFTANAASSNGGAIYAKECNLTMHGGEFSFNGGKGGGAVYVVNEAKTETAFVSKGKLVLKGNTATGNGGALYLYDNASGSFETVEATENEALGNGGALYISGKAKFSFDELNASKNKAAKAVVYMTSGSTELTVKSGTFAQNETEDGNDIYQHSKSGAFYGTLTLDTDRIVHDGAIVGDVNEIA